MLTLNRVRSRHTAMIAAAGYIKDFVFLIKGRAKLISILHLEDQRKTIPVNP